ncbi:hypothetical protein HN51_017472 [Arachis hypogaea]|nr:transcription factor RAX2 [Arachis ipaensis]XP_025660147.1 transcription factor RAX2 [Arachis hypogaea]QHN88667.1 uncharacterized protein DS421_16g565400 [Arachis hypogaea]
MGRAPCCDKANVKRGPWSPDEDATLKNYLHTHGTGGNWIALPRKAGLRRCGKSCRLRWLNYLRPDIKHGGFTEQEDQIICTLYTQMGSRWSAIASQLPGRTDNDVKNYWNTKLKKKLMAGKVISPNNNNNNKTLLTTQQNSDFQDNKNCSPPSSSSSLVHLPILSNDINNFSSNLSLDLIHQQLYSPQFMNLEIDGANSRSNKNNNSSNIEGSTSSSSLALLDYKGGSSLLEEEKQHGVGDDNDESNKEFLMDLGFDGVPTYYDIVNGLNCHERVVGEFSQSISSCCYSEWVDFNCAEIKPH